jgi:ribosomal protein L20
MPRTKTGVVRRRHHKKILKLNKGFRGANRRLYKRAKEASLHAGQYAMSVANCAKETCVNCGLFELMLG